jgi:hypothetical protein
VRQSNNDGPEKYVWDWNGEVVEFGRRIYTIKAAFSNDGQSNYDILKNNNLLDVDEERLIYCENRIYQFNPNSDERVIKFWEVSSLYIETIDGIKYCIGTSFPKHDGLLDITNDDQLANWYLSKVVKKNWAEITQCKSFRNLEGFLVELLATLKNLDEPTLQSRLNRLRRINSSLSISFESLKEISEAPWFGDVVRKSIAEERVQLLEYLSKENDTELKKIKEGYSLELLRLEEEQSKEINELRQKFDETLNIFYEKECAVEKRLKEKSIELDLLDESANEKKLLLTTLENSIATLNERKTSIIQDFSVIKEVLNATSKTALQDEKTIVKDFFSNDVKISDNNTLIISEQEKCVFLPYTISELSSYLELYPKEYNCLSNVVNKEFILPLDYYTKHPSLSRFREAYSLIRDKEAKTVFEALKYSSSLMFKYDLNPAIISACKTEEALNHYIDCLENNKLDDFNVFKIEYKINPMITT